MARLLALNALFFMVPFAVYAGWLFVKTRSFGSAEDWSNRRIIILCSIGAVFVVIGLVLLTSFSADDSGAPYIPAEIVDGEIVPGRFGE